MRLLLIALLILASIVLNGVFSSNSARADIQSGSRKPVIKSSESRRAEALENLLHAYEENSSLSNDCQNWIKKDFETITYIFDETVPTIYIKIPEEQIITIQGQPSWQITALFPEFPKKTDEPSVTWSYYTDKDAINVYMMSGRAFHWASHPKIHIPLDNAVEPSEYITPPSSSELDKGYLLFEDVTNNSVLLTWPIDKRHAVLYCAEGRDCEFRGMPEGATPDLKSIKESWPYDEFAASMDRTCKLMASEDMRTKVEKFQHKMSICSSLSGTNALTDGRKKILHDCQVYREKISPKLEFFYNKTFAD